MDAKIHIRCSPMQTNLCENLLIFHVRPVHCGEAWYMKFYWSPDQFFFLSQATSCSFLMVAIIPQMYHYPTAPWQNLKVDRPVYKSQTNQLKFRDVDRELQLHWRPHSLNQEVHQNIPPARQISQNVRQTPLFQSKPGLGVWCVSRSCTPGICPIPIWYGV